MKIDCDKCHARYHMDRTRFQGAKGIRVRCRRCGNSFYVLNTGGTAQERKAADDAYPSDNRDTEPSVSLAGREQSTSPEMEWTLPSGEPATLSRENGEEEDPWEEIWRKPLPAPANAHAPLMFYPPFPKSPGKDRSRSTFRRSSLVVLCIVLLLVACGTAYLVFTPAGEKVLAGIGRDLAEAVTYFQS